MSWNFYRPYVSVAQRRANAARHAQKLAKKGRMLAPVRIEGRTIATTFWGKAWCGHLESFSDYANRLPRGRTYVRNGSVLDVQIAPGKITAMIMGSTLYHGTIAIAPLKPARWKAIKAECAGKIDSLVGLLQGRLSDAVMRVITDREKGLFPLPSEIKLNCSCPDWADLCKHLAAVLYGVGARLDTQPELLFVLRGVDHLELISAAADVPALAAGTGAETSGLDVAQLSDVFGIEIEPLAAAAKPVKAAASKPVATAASAEGKVKKTPRPKAGKGTAKTKTTVTPKTATKRGRTKL
ncbi:MAG: SWIM zinc finger family protein [Verrucomicrobia bacterium]|nr:SWIM zinc finger family protein [Verrucomicrobiota bacterium]